MGNDPVREHPFNRQQWELMEKNTSYILWRSRRDPSLQLEQHDLYSRGEAELTQQREAFYFRHNHPHLVAAFYLQSQQQGQQFEFCAARSQHSLFIERIPLRLTDIGHIPFPDYLHLYQQALIGFHQITQQYGCFQVEEEYFGVNDLGTVKVWMNRDYSKSVLVGGRIGQEQMVKGVVDIIDANCDHLKMEGTPTVRNYLYRNADMIRFPEALRQLNEYARHYCRGQVPGKLDCIERVGGINVILNRESQEEENYNTMSRKTLPVQQVGYHRPKLVTQTAIGGLNDVGYVSEIGQPSRQMQQVSQVQYAQQVQVRKVQQQPPQVLQVSQVRQIVQPVSQIVQINQVRQAQPASQVQIGQVRQAPPQIQQQVIANSASGMQLGLRNNESAPSVRREEGGLRVGMFRQPQQVARRRNSQLDHLSAKIAEKGNTHPMKYSQTISQSHPIKYSQTIGHPNWNMPHNEPSRGNITFNTFQQSTPSRHPSIAVAMASTNPAANYYRLPSDSLNQKITFKQGGPSSQPAEMSEQSIGNFISNSSQVNPQPLPIRTKQEPSVQLQQVQSAQLQKGPSVQVQELQPIVYRQEPPRTITFHNEEQKEQKQQKEQIQQIVQSHVQARPSSHQHTPSHFLPSENTFEERAMSHGEKPEVKVISESLCLQGDNLETSNSRFVEDVPPKYSEYATPPTITVDDGKSSDDFMKKLKEITSGLGQGKEEATWHNYSSSNYSNNYNNSSSFNNSDSLINQVTEPFPNETAYFNGGPSYAKTALPADTHVDDQDFGRNAVSNIIECHDPQPPPKYQFGGTPQPLKFQKDLQMKYSILQVDPQPLKPNRFGQYQKDMALDILIDQRKIKS